MNALLVFIGKYLGWTVAGKIGWFGFKAYAKYSDNLYDDAIVLLKQGFEKGDDEAFEKAMDMIAKEWAEK